jgi:hypothetical protein
MKKLTTLITLTTLPGMALAHGDAGHGFMSNLEHVLSSAAHLWPLAVTALVAAAVKRPVQRLLKQRTAHKD